MARIVGTYQCEWKTTIDDPEKIKAFRPFLNSSEPDPSIAFVREREQHRPATWAEKRSLVETRKIRLPVLSV
jgi:nitrite reductase (NADH) large subunit